MRQPGGSRTAGIPAGPKRPMVAPNPNRVPRSPELRTTRGRPRQGTVLRRAQASGWRASEEGNGCIGVSSPRPVSIRGSPPDSGVVPFSSRSRHTPIRASSTSLVTSGLPLESLRATQIPTSPGSWEHQTKATVPTGLAVARGQLRRALKARGSKQVSRGPWRSEEVREQVHDPRQTTPAG